MEQNPVGVRWSSLLPTCVINARASVKLVGRVERDHALLQCLENCCQFLVVNCFLQFKAQLGLVPVLLLIKTVANAKELVKLFDVVQILVVYGLTTLLVL